VQRRFDHSPWIEWNSINSEGALCGSLDRNVLLKTYRDMLRRTCGSMKRRISHGQAIVSAF
jgi:hypothetical protein